MNQGNLKATDKRVAIVTGCAKHDGLGAAIARALVEAGIAVAITDVNRSGARSAVEQKKELGFTSAGLEELAAELQRAGGSVLPTYGDVSKEEDVAAMVKATVARFGRLDIVVNNAAAPHGADFNDIVDVPFADLDRVFRINAIGAFLMMKAAVPQMRERKWGRMVNIASINGKIGAARQAVYGGSKAALIGMTRAGRDYGQRDLPRPHEDGQEPEWDGSSRRRGRRRGRARAGRRKDSPSQDVRAVRSGCRRRVSLFGCGFICDRSGHQRGWRFVPGIASHVGARAFWEER